MRDGFPNHAGTEVGGFGGGGAVVALVSVITLPPQADRQHRRTRARMGEIVLNTVSSQPIGAID